MAVGPQCPRVCEVSYLTYLPYGDDELARPEIGEQKIQRCITNVVVVRERLHGDGDTRVCLDGMAGYLRH